MVKKRTKKVRSTTLKTREGTLAGFTKVGKKFALVFSKNRKKVIGKSKFKNMTTMKARVKSMLKK